MEGYRNIVLTKKISLWGDGRGWVVLTEIKDWLEANKLKSVKFHTFGPLPPKSVKEQILFF